MKNEEWSQEELDLLSSDLTVGEIARKTNRTTDAIYKKKQRMGLNNPFEVFLDIKKLGTDHPVAVFVNDSNEIIVAIDSKQKDKVVIEFK
jgi:hypothetical protein